MKTFKIFVIFLLLTELYSQKIIAQTTQQSQKQPDSASTRKDDVKQPIDSLDEAYPECDMKELASRVKYPDEAINKEIEGTVILRCLIDTSGKVIKTMIERSDNPIFDQAVIDALKTTKFSPACQYGKPIFCWVSIPINFHLTGNSSSIWDFLFGWLF